MNNTRLRWVVPIAGSALSGCSLFLPWGSLYSGDGTYVKGVGMYQVRVLEVPLDRANSRCATLEQLGPSWQWTVGIRLEPQTADALTLYRAGTSQLRDELIPQARVALRLSDDANREVFSIAAPLARWKWNWNYAYFDGRGEEYQSAPGTWSFRRFDVGPDEGWGSHFTPRYSGKYALCYSVEEPAPLRAGLTAVLTVETYLGSL